MFTVARIYSIKIVKKLSSSSKIYNFSTICMIPQSAECLCSQAVRQSIQFYRYKSKDKNKSKKEGTESESEESEKDFLEGLQDKHTKVVKVNVTSMRLDVILKIGLGLSRNKLETIFYESKIRLNGEKLLKKSVHTQEGDEIDVIKGSNMENKDFLTVARVEILSAVGKDESISVKLRRCKSLTIDNYEGRNRWEG